MSVHQSFDVYRLSFLNILQVALHVPCSSRHYRHAVVCSDELIHPAFPSFRFLFRRETLGVPRCPLDSQELDVLLPGLVPDFFVGSANGPRKRERPAIRDCRNHGQVVPRPHTV